jgi:hypothetical protein
MGRGVTDCLDIVAVGVEHERPVVVLRVLGPSAGLPIVAAARRERRRVEGIDLGPGVGREGDLQLASHLVLL